MATREEIALLGSGVESAELAEPKAALDELMKRARLSGWSEELFWETRAALARELARNPRASLDWATGTLRVAILSIPIPL